MRGALLAAAVVLALAACSVDVEGAPCATPGEAADCPSGQACGVDGRCSRRAAACTDPSARCTPGALRCSSPGERVETCTASDPCGAWELPQDGVDCAARGLVCADAGAGPACACPAYAGTEFAVDPDAASDAAGVLIPTGAASPPSCRFGRLSDAVARAAMEPGPATVRAYGTGDVVFGAATGDGPIVVPANVTVAGSDDATSTSLRAGAAGGEAIVTLQGRLEGFRIEATSGDGVGVATACDASAVPSLDDVTVAGGGTLAAGIDVSGPCGAELSDVDVSGVAGAALRVRADPGAPVTVHGGSLTSSHVGARIAGGSVALGDDSDSSTLDVGANRDEGVLLEAGARIDATLVRARIHDNGGTGVVVSLVSAGSSVAVRGCAVHSNGRTAGAPRKYGPGAQREVGGMLVKQGALPFTFTGNRFYGNAGDQLAFESSASWSIAAAACGGATNLFACVDPDAFAVAITGGSVDAKGSVWPDEPVDPFASAGVTHTPYCNGTAGFAAKPACPVP